MISSKQKDTTVSDRLRRFRLCVDWGLLGLLLIAVLINLPGLLGYILPAHDTMFMYQTFYYFYNDFFLSGEAPRWLSFGLYGVQSDNSIVAIMTPATYFSGLLGYLAGVKNTLSLFHLSILIEEVTLLLGTYLLAGRLFRHRSTVFIVSLVTLCSSVMMVQFLLNFHIFSLLPLIFYLLLKGFDKHSYRHLVLAMVVFILSLFGNPPYFTPIPMLAVLIFLAAIVISNARRLGGFLKPSRADLAAAAFFFLILVGITGLYYRFISNAMDHTHGIYIGRDPVTLKTNLDTFLTYAYDSGFKKFKGIIWPYRFVFDDLSLHVGFITLLFALYGLVFVRSVIVYAIAIEMLVFGLLSLGSKTPVAELLYHHFPLMDYFRHIRDVVSNYKLFVPLLAGFGLEGFLCFAQKKETRARSLMLGAEVLAATAVIIGSIIYTMELAPWLTLYAVAITIVFLAVIFFLSYRTEALKGTLHLLTALFLFQMLGYQVLVNGAMYNFSRPALPVAPNATSVYDYRYQNARTVSPSGKRMLDAVAFANISKVNYSFGYNFLLWDTCASIQRVDFVNENVYTYFRLKGADFVDINPWNNTYGKRLELPRDLHFLNSVGCNSAKLKLYKTGVFSDSIEQTKELIKNSEKIDERIVLNGVDRNGRHGWPAPGTIADGFARGAVRVRHFRANRLSLDVDVREERGAWLYYADAYHPGWKAFVNGASTHVAQANIAFKAVPLGPGKSTVEFVFDSEPARTIGRLLALIGIIFTVVILCATGICCLLKDEGCKP